MAKMTLLEMTQNILSSMDSDDVNSISDTSESLQVASVIQETFYEQFLNRALPEGESLVQLTALADTNRPNYLQIPDNVLSIKWFKYDDQSNGDGSYNDVLWQDPESFLFHMTSTSVGQENVQVVQDFSGANIAIWTNQAPTIWTTFDDKYIVTNGYNSATEATLQSSRSLCWGQTDPTFDLSDSSIAPIDSNLFPLLLAEAKSVCFINFKGQANPKEEQKSKRQQQRSQKYLWKARQRINDDYSSPNYARVVK